MNAQLPKVQSVAYAPPKAPADSTAELGAELGEYELLVTGHGAVSKVSLVTDCPLLIGRGEEADLSLASGSISRRHVRVCLKDSTLTLEDLDSSNGTLVRGARVPSRRPISLAPGESFVIGDFVVVFGARRSNRSASLAESSNDRGNVILRSSQMSALYRQTDPVARAFINVLILGETGVGKDVFARSIHARSERRDRPFLQLNCAAFSESLLESELFGHEKGAFTGATARKQGLLATASGGTVFLDEIGELPACLQARVLHVLETQEVMSVGGLKPYSIDVRFIAATNRDLESEATAGRFRSDLFYRLAAFTVHIPPLRDRHDDILPLAREFLRRASGKADSPVVPSIGADAATKLLAYSWPGNLRELRNVMERALLLSEGSAIRPEHLQLGSGRNGQRAVVALSGGTAYLGAELTPKEQAERQRIVDALVACAGNQSKTAAMLGISRSTLINRLDAYRIGRPRKRPT